MVIIPYSCIYRENGIFKSSEISITVHHKLWPLKFHYISLEFKRCAQLFAKIYLSVLLCTPGILPKK